MAHAQAGPLDSKAPTCEHEMLRMVRFVIIALALAGCGGERGLPLRHWELQVPGPSPAFTQVTLPARLDQVTGPRFLLRTTEQLPPDLVGAPLELVIPDLGGLASLRAGGMPALENDPPRARVYRSRGPTIWEIPQTAVHDGTLELELSVERRWTQGAWIETVPRLVHAGGGGGQAATWLRICNLFVSGAALVALFQVGVTSLMVFFVDRRRRAYLWFGIQALLACFYPLFVLGWSQLIFGVYDVPMLAVALIVALAASVHFTHGFFDLGPASRTWRPAAALACLACVVCSGPFISTQVGAAVILAFFCAVVVFQVSTCVRLLKRHPDLSSATFLMLSWLGLGVTASPDLAAWLGLGDLLGGARLASVGLALFAAWLSLLLSRRHIVSLNRADELNVELEGRVEQLQRRGIEIEHLNEELRRQIAERSSQIFAALALSEQRRETAPELAVDEVIQGRYRVVGRLGAGGMGAVYEVVRVSDGRRLALKLAREVNGLALARLAREAQVACRVSHPNVVGILDVDVATSGFLYIVMELIEGAPLSADRARFGDAAWALPLLQQMAEGLKALHAADVVHRDLKPANILVTDDGRGGRLVKITDFGISLHTTGPHPLQRLDDLAVTAELGPHHATPPAADPEATATIAAQRLHGGKQTAPPAEPALTGTGMLPGTPAYIAPELVGGREHVSSSADLFAFGVIAFEMLTGARPFTEAPSLALLAGRQPPRSERLASRYPGAPVELAALIDACLAEDPAARPSAAQVVAVLTRILAAVAATA